MSSTSPRLKSPGSTADPDFWIESKHSATELCLPYRLDTYGGIIIDSSDLPDNIDEFRSAMRCSLTELGLQGNRKAFWIRIPTSSIEFVPVCIREFDFYIHHAKKDYVMMVKWTDPTNPNPIPPPSTHQVGVGCAIDRGDGYIILVKERTGPASVGSGIWKLPTGLVDPAEDICQAAIREAKEETGLDCRFASILAFRQSHGGSPTLGACSDLFFVCLLYPINESQQVVMQESEIQDIMWIHHSQIHSVTQCTQGSAAWELMENVGHLVSGEDGVCEIKAKKLPAWRRKNCDQYIYSPSLYLGRNH